MNENNHVQLQNDSIVIEKLFELSSLAVVR